MRAAWGTAMLTGAFARPLIDDRGILNLSTLHGVIRALSFCHPGHELSEVQLADPGPRRYLDRQQAFDGFQPALE